MSISVKLTIGDITLLSVTLWESEDDKLQRVAAEVEQVTSVAGEVQYTEPVEELRNGHVGFHADIVGSGLQPGVYEGEDDDGLTRGLVRGQRMERARQRT